MSVFVFDSKEIGRLTTTLFTYKNKIFTHSELRDMKKDAEMLKKNVDDYEKSNVIWFVNRLYFYNQVAYYRNYCLSDSEPISIDNITNEDLQVQLPLGKKALLSKLTELRYNMKDNNGYTFAPDIDISRLNRLIEYLALQIALYDD
jgi:hypothetical protein